MRRFPLGLRRAEVASRREARRQRLSPRLVAALRARQRRTHGAGDRWGDPDDPARRFARRCHRSRLLRRDHRGRKRRSRECRCRDRGSRCRRARTRERRSLWARIVAERGRWMYGMSSAVGNVADCLASCDPSVRPRGNCIKFGTCKLAYLSLDSEIVSGVNRSIHVTKCCVQGLDSHTTVSATLVTNPSLLLPQRPPAVPPTPSLEVN